MCGRLALLARMRQLMEEPGIDAHDAADVAQRYIVAPSQCILAVVNDGEGNRFGTFKWGLTRPQDGEW